MGIFMFDVHYGINWTTAATSNGVAYGIVFKLIES